jgi:2-oxo-4-hydroxy-4-carboxy-5-ureidoimidazoline decarboxylase
MTLAERLNGLDENAAQQALGNCCAAPGWVASMLACRPFADDSHVNSMAMDIWWSLPRDEWLTAFAAHPKIGDLQTLQKKFASTANWASDEQAGVAQASDDTLLDLARYNAIYEVRFGYIFIVCATGKSAAEMLSLLKCRIANEPAEELRIAAAEQLKITLLRLEKLNS